MDAEDGPAVTALATSYFSSVLDWLSDGANWRGSEGVPHRLLEHIQISLVSLVIAIIIALPIGLFFGHLRRGGFVVINIANLTNVEAFQYDYRFKDKAPITSYPILPTLGIRGTW